MGSTKRLLKGICAMHQWDRNVLFVALLRAVKERRSMLPWLGVDIELSHPIVRSFFKFSIV